LASHDLKHADLRRRDFDASELPWNICSMVACLGRKPGAKCCCRRIAESEAAEERTR